MHNVQSLLYTFYKKKKGKATSRLFEMKMFDALITPERLEVCRADRTATREKYFADAEGRIGREAVEELRSLYKIFDERMYIWLAGLWEPEIGGFYFSSSGRDTEGFLPDIESTVQALTFMETSGLTDGKKYIDAASDLMKEALTRFVKSLEDPEDGYFYHPQWGKNIITARRGRDLSWSLQLLRALDVTPDYPTATERLASADKKDNALIPGHFRSIEAFGAYLDEMLAFTDPKKKSYWVANAFQSQTVQIKAAGQEYIDLFFKKVEEKQLPSNGLWEEQVNYASVNGLMKFALIYTAFDKPIKYAVKALNSTIDAAMSDEHIVFCCQFYNPHITINNLLHNMKLSGNAEQASELRQVIINRAPEYLRISREKIRECRSADGAFSYNSSHAYSKLSQKAPVSLGLNEGDVNATGISSTGCIRNICANLELPVIPMFGREDAKLFYQLIDNAYVHEKLIPKPAWFDDAIDPEKLTDTY